jgi:hypothetical protein
MRPFDWLAVAFVGACLVGWAVDRAWRRRSGALGGNVVRVPIVDVGTPPSRRVDLREVPFDGLVTYALVDRLRSDFERLERQTSAPTCVTWTLAASTASKLDALSDTAHVLLWARLVGLAPRASHVLTLDGATLSAETTARIEGCGLMIATRVTVLSETSEA